MRYATAVFLALLTASAFADGRDHHRRPPPDTPVPPPSVPVPPTAPAPEPAPAVGADDSARRFFIGVAAVAAFVCVARRCWEERPPRLRIESRPGDDR